MRYFDSWQGSKKNEYILTYIHAYIHIYIHTCVCVCIGMGIIYRLCIWLCVCTGESEVLQGTFPLYVPSNVPYVCEATYLHAFMCLQLCVCIFIGMSILVVYMVAVCTWEWGPTVNILYLSIYVPDNVPYVWGCFTVTQPLIILFSVTRCTCLKAQSIKLPYFSSILHDIKDI